MTEKVPEGPEVVVGNTKQLPPETKRDNARKHWFWTEFVEEDNHEEYIKRLGPVCQEYVFQLEKCPSSGKLHYQGTMILKKKSRLKAVKTLLGPTAHLEPTKCGEEAKQYCQKTETRVAGPWVWPAVLKECDQSWMKWAKLKVFQRKIVDIVETTPDERSIYWFWETKGDVGKTTFCKYLFSKYKVSVSTSGMSEKDLFYIVSEEKPRCLIIDLPREDQKKGLKLGPVEQVKNGFFGTGKYEGKSYCGPNPHVIIFANRAPMDEELDSLSKDRWIICEIAGELLDFEKGEA